MSRKKRMFDIEMPDDVIVPDTAPASAEAAKKRSPMASAIAENAEARLSRQATEAAIRSENDALAQEFVALREAGAVVLSVPLDEVHTRLLVRDRHPGEDLELADLTTSIREVGLSNPIRVLPRPDGTGYELVQGFRRLAAFRALRQEDLSAEGQGTWNLIPALVMPGAPDIPGLYRRMVDENVIRKDLSFAEMAMAATNYAADPATDAGDLKKAIGALFQSAPYSKRSYIRSFARLLELIGADLKYPTAVPRKLGVDLSRVLDAEPDVVRRVKEGLAGWKDRSVEDELNLLRRYAGADNGDESESATPARRKSTVGGAADPSKTKTTFDLRTASGRVKCTAAVGRLEIKVNRDFSTMDRARLERAIAALVDGLD